MLSEREATRILHEWRGYVFSLVLPAVRGWSDEDAEEMAANALYDAYRAICDYDESRGTHITTCIYTYVRKSIRRMCERRKSLREQQRLRELPSSGDANYFHEHSARDSIIERIPDNFDRFARVDAAQTFDAVCEKLNLDERNKRILRAIGGGRTYDSIAIELGVRRQAVDQRLKKIAKHARELDATYEEAYTSRAVPKGEPK
jgi:RNA polymerase sigma factor (sigma-70 family)